MAEPEKPEEKKKLINRFLPTRSFFTRLLRNILAKYLPSEALPHHKWTPGMDITEIPTFKTLNAQLNFKIVAALNTQQIRTERNWDGSKGEDIDSVNKYRKIVLDLFTKTKWEGVKDVGEINEAIGPWTDIKALEREANFVQYGTTYRSGVPLEIIPIRINRDGRPPVDSIFHVPPQVPIIYTDGRRGRDRNGNPITEAYYVRYIGYNNESYWNQLNADIDNICELVANDTLSMTTDLDEQKNIKANIEKLREEITSLAGKIKTFTNSKEREYYVALDDVKRLYTPLGKALEEVAKLKLTDEQVHFTHTFRIVKPVIYNLDGTVKDSLQAWYMDPANPNPTFKKLDNEVDWGLDENGWPLEVGDGKTRFEGVPLRMGEVLLDKYLGEIRNDPHRANNPRVVPEEFTEEMDPLAMITFLYVYYDAYRDDLRDARYHEGAITLQERIKVELGVQDNKYVHTGIDAQGRDKYEERKQTMEDIEAGRHAVVEVKLNKLPGGATPGRIPNDPAFVRWKVKPKDRSPAFDLRALRTTVLGKEIDKQLIKHWGRPFYYETQNDQIERYQVKDKTLASPRGATITTRGAALYMFHRVIEEVKHWGGEAERKGVLELFTAIGEQTEGWDIGPNMGEGETGWGKNLTWNPLKPFRG